MPYGNPVGPGGSLAWVLFYSAIPMLVHHFYQQDKLRDQQEVFSQMDAEFDLPENETFDFIIGRHLIFCNLTWAMIKTDLLTVLWFTNFTNIVYFKLELGQQDA